MRVKGLGILLQVVSDPRPASGHFEETPIPGGNPLRPGIGRLPAPQTVETNPFSSRRGLVIRLGHVPDGLHAVGQVHRDVVSPKLWPQRNYCEQRDEPDGFEWARVGDGAQGRWRRGTAVHRAWLVQV